MLLLLAALLTAHADEGGLGHTLPAEAVQQQATPAPPPASDASFSERKWDGQETEADKPAVERRMDQMRKQVAGLSKGTAYRAGPEQRATAEFDFPWQMMDIAPLLDAGQPTFKPARKQLASHVQKHKYGDGEWAFQSWRSNYQVTEQGSATQVQFWTRELVHERGVSDRRTDWLVTMNGGRVTEAYMRTDRTDWGNETFERIYSFQYDQSGQLNGWSELMRVSDLSPKHPTKRIEAMVYSGV